MSSAKSQSTANDSKPKPKINNQNSRNWPASKSSCVTTKTVPIAEHSRNSKKKFDTKHFVCSTCQKYVFNANHDSCVTKFLNEVNSRAKVPSHKTTKRYKPIEQISIAKKPERQVPTGHRFSIKKTSSVHEKTMIPRSCLRYKRPCCSLIPAESDSLPHAHSQTTKIYYWHQDSRIKKAQVHTKTNISANSDIKDFPSKTKLRGRLLESFQDDAKYEHVGQDTRSQGGKDDQDKQGKDLDISKSKTKSKDNDKGSRSEITQHEGTSLQPNKDQIFKNSMTKQSQQVQGNKIQDLTLRIKRPHIKGDC
ncbi:hypothetical protein Tco_1556033 [Tanacetum coccineum]